MSSVQGAYMNGVCVCGDERYDLKTQRVGEIATNKPKLRPRSLKEPIEVLGNV